MSSQPIGSPLDQLCAHSSTNDSDPLSEYSTARLVRLVRVQANLLNEVARIFNREANTDAGICTRITDVLNNVEWKG